MSEAERFESTTQLLRPDQIDDFNDEIERMENTLSAPAHITNVVQERRAMAGRLSRLKRQLEDQTPKPYATDQLDRAKRREIELREKYTQGMPTGAEMRRNPAGAVDKHMKWEGANKRDILEWKNIQRRLEASGHVEGARDLANIERFRPTGGAQELNMDNEQIQGTQYNFPPGGPKVVNGLSDEDYDEVQRMKREMQEAIDEINALKAQVPVKKKRGPSEWNLIVGKAKRLDINTKGKRRPEIEAEIAAKIAERTADSEALRSEPIERAVEG